MKNNNSVNREITVTDIVLEYEDMLADVKKELAKEKAKTKAQEEKIEKANKALEVTRQNIGRLRCSHKYKPTDEKLAGLIAYQQILAILK